MNTFTQRCIPGLIATLTMLLFSAPTMALSGRAAGDQFKMNINISGTVVATGSCTFNHPSRDDLDFGNITYSSISGFRLIGEYRITLDGAMSCSGDTDGSTIMTFSDFHGDGLDFNGHKVLSTTNTNNLLGVELLVDGVPQDVGSSFKVDMANPPSLEARLVQVGTGSPPPSWTGIDGNLAIAELRLTMEFQ